MNQVKGQSSQKIDSVFIIKTPFHFLFFRRLLTTNLVDSRILLLVNNNLLDRLEKKQEIYLQNVNVETLPDIEFYVAKLLRNPFFEWWRVRKEIRTVSKFVRYILDKYSTPGKLYIFNDKDVLTQLYIRKVKKSAPLNVIAIEEGTSFYKNERKMDDIYKVLYKLTSPFVLGFPYHYVNTYGSSKVVDEVYLRFPEYVPKNKNLRKKKITKIDLYKQKILIKPKSRSILLLSSPLFEYFVLTNGLEKEVCYDLLQYAKENKHKLFLKPHPKEQPEKYARFINNIEVIDNLTALEDLELSEFRTIVNFASSAILDVVDRDYPVKNIITINPYKTNLSLENIYKRTNYMSVYSKNRLVNYRVIHNFMMETLRKVFCEID